MPLPQYAFALAFTAALVVRGTWWCAYICAYLIPGFHGALLLLVILLNALLSAIEVFQLIVCVSVVFIREGKVGLCAGVRHLRVHEMCGAVLMCLCLRV